MFLFWINFAFDNKEQDRLSKKIASNVDFQSVLTPHRSIFLNGSSDVIIKYLKFLNKRINLIMSRVFFIFFYGHKNRFTKIWLKCSLSSKMSIKQKFQNDLFALEFEKLQTKLNSQKKIRLRDPLTPLKSRNSN